MELEIKQSMSRKVTCFGDSCRRYSPTTVYLLLFQN